MTNMAATDPHSATCIPGLVWAFRFGAEGAAQLLAEPVDISVLDPVGAVADGSWLWLHFSLSDARARRFIERLPLPERAIAGLLNDDTHANLHLEGETAFGALTDWHYEAAPGLPSVGQLRFALATGLIVSARMHPLRSVESVRQRVEGGARIASAQGMLEVIVEEFAGAVAHAHEEMAQTLDDIEDRVLGEALRDERRQLGLLRWQAVRLHRPLHALQRVLAQFEARHRGHTTHGLLDAAARLSQRIDHLDAEVVAMERRARLLHDEVATKLAEQTNRQVYVLTVLSALFMPPALVFGFFGVNTGGLPLTQDANGSLIAFVLGLLASVGVWLILRWVRNAR